MSVDELEIPDKRHFKIGEVAGLLDLEPYVLRYWETEFDVLAPAKTDSGQRTYTVDDIELVNTIRHLLYDEMFTIAGARRQLERKREGKPSMLDDAQDREDPAELSARVDELEQRNAALEQRAHEQSELIEKVRGERDEFVARAERLQAELADADSDGRADEDLIAENEALREEVDHLETQLQKSRVVVAELEDQAEALRERLDGGAAISPDLLSALRREVSQLRGAARPS